MSALDKLIGLVSPRLAFERQAWRQAAAELGVVGERSYAAAARGRKAADWRASYGSVDAELFGDLSTLRARSRQMVRDNPYLTSALRHLTANIVGTGIEMRAVHPDPEVAKRAQGLFAQWANEPIDVEERLDFYGVQKLAVRAMIEGGECLTVWRSEGRNPDARVQLIEGEQLDATQNRVLDNGGRIVSGVEYDKSGRRVAYHLFEHHPGDHIAYLGVRTQRVDARDVDHLFEAVRPGQTRGVPWFASVLLDIREIAGLEESIRIKKRVEACLSVFRKAGEGQTGSPLGQQTAQADGPSWERLVPGMVIQGKPGEEIQVINPSSVGDSDGFMRFQLMKGAAGIGLPYSLMTGDVSQANYSSERAARVGFGYLLDDWTYNTVAPLQCDRGARRRLRVEALRRNDPALLEVRAEWTPPKRPWVDPLKDITAEILEVRAFGGLPEAFSSRGRDYREALAEAAGVFKLIDDLGLALDSDPRRVNGSGGLQPAAGYLRPTGDAQA